MARRPSNPVAADSALVSFLGRVVCVECCSQELTAVASVRWVGDLSSGT